MTLWDLFLTFLMVLGTITVTAGLLWVFTAAWVFYVENK